MPVNLNDPSLVADKKIAELVKQQAIPKQYFPDNSTPPPLTETDVEAKPESEVVEQTKANAEKEVQEKPKPSNSEKDFEKIGLHWFKTVDIPLTGIAAFVASEPATEFSLDEKNQQWLIEQLAVLAEDSDWGDPGPWPALIAAGLFGYGGMMRNAYSIRKEKQQEKKQAAVQKRAEQANKDESKDNKDRK